MTVVNGTTESLVQPAFVLVNYYLKLGDFTDEWDMVNDKGEGLHIGVLHFNNTKMSNFCSRVHPRRNLNRGSFNTEKKGQ